MRRVIGLVVLVVAFSCDPKSQLGERISSLTPVVSDATMLDSVPLSPDGAVDEVTPQQLDQQIAVAQAAWERETQPLALLRTNAMQHRALVEVEIGAASVRTGADGTAETAFAARLVRVHKSVAGYQPNLISVVIRGGRTAAGIWIDSEQPEFRSGRHYLILSPFHEGEWRGLSEWDVIAIAGDGFLYERVTVTSAELDTAMEELGRVAP